MMEFPFQYFVGKNHGLRDTFDQRAGVEAGFYSHALPSAIMAESGGDAVERMPIIIIYEFEP